MKWIIRNIESFIISIIFIVLILVYSFFKIDTKILVGLFGTVATIYLGLIKSKIENDKLFKSLFTEFNSRYDKDLNDLINRIRDDIKYELNSSEKNLIIDYFNLCSEEYLWRRRNRIPNSVWESWKAGIKENLEIKQVREIYDKETKTENGSNSFYGLVKELSMAASL